MKILFVANDIPYPPSDGIRIVLYNIMRLVARDHQTALMILSEKPEKIKKEDIEHLQGFCEDVTIKPLKKRSMAGKLLAAVFHSKLYYIERFRDEDFRMAIRNKIEQWHPDVVHFDMINTSQYGISIDPSIPKVVSINDSYALTLENELKHPMRRKVWLQLYKTIQLIFTRKYESEVYPKYDYCHVVSAVDSAYLRKLNPSINTVVIPNGVDSDYLKPLQKEKDKSARKNVIFVSRGGGMIHLESFLLESWPLIISKVKDATITVVGNAPSPFLQKIASETGGVIFKGFVPELKDVYNTGLISAVPIRKNHGILNKALEAMSMGLAVAGFDESFAGIPQARHNQNCICCQNYEELALEIIKLLESPEKAISLGLAARDLITTHYRWSSRRESFEHMYEDAVRIHKDR